MLNPAVACWLSTSSAFLLTNSLCLFLNGHYHFFPNLQGTEGRAVESKTFNMFTTWV